MPQDLKYQVGVSWRTASRATCVGAGVGSGVGPAGVGSGVGGQKHVYSSVHLEQQR